MGWFKKKILPHLHYFRNRVNVDGINAIIVSDTGCVRLNNEDNALISFPAGSTLLSKKGLLLVLADGMGGHRSGEVASQLAVESFTKAYFSSSARVEKSLMYAMDEANNKVYNTSMTDDIYYGMGTTLTAIVVNDDHLYLAHIGDSRAYIFNKESFVQISKDHTLVQQQIDAGEISPETAETHPDRNVLLHALGTKPEIDADIIKLNHRLLDDNILLICSDGLYDLVKDIEITMILENDNNLETMAKTLVQKAKLKGGYDNITVLLATRRVQTSIPQLKNTNDYDIEFINKN